jgi:Cof subfamily protein (haloacid dehalogenase superfamily)
LTTTDDGAPPAVPEGLAPGGRFRQWRPGCPRYVVADVDGTLIAEGTTAQPATAAAVARARVDGLVVGFATGRAEPAVADLRRQLEPDGPSVLLNGAELRAGERVVATWPISTAQVQRLLRVCQQEGWYAEFYIEEGFVVTDHRPQAHPHWEEVTGPPLGLVADVDLAQAKVSKVTALAFADEDVAPAVSQMRHDELAIGVGSSPTTPGVAFVNVTRRDADKGQAVTEATRRLGCSLAETAVVGDGDNDIPMLNRAGTAVAMGQAPAEVYEAAHLVAPEVRNDGMATVLTALMLLRHELC